MKRFKQKKSRGITRLIEKLEKQSVLVKWSMKAVRAVNDWFDYMEISQLIRGYDDKKSDAKDTEYSIYSAFTKATEQTKKKILSKKSEELLGAIKKNKKHVFDLWNNMDSSLQQENAELLANITDIMNGENEEDIRYMAEMWVNASPEIQLKNAELLPKILSYVSGSVFADIWIKTCPAVQKINETVLVEYSNKYGYYISEILNNTQEDIQSDIVETLIEQEKKNGIRVLEIWQSISEEAKQQHYNLLPKVLEYASNNSEDQRSDNEMRENYREIWSVAPKQVQEEMIDILVQKFHGNTELLYELWDNLDGEIKVRKHEIFREIINNCLINEQNSISFSSSLILELWKRAGENIQSENSNLFPKQYNVHIRLHRKWMNVQV